MLAAYCGISLSNAKNSASDRRAIARDIFSVGASDSPRGGEGLGGEMEYNKRIIQEDSQ